MFQRKKTLKSEESECKDKSELLCFSLSQNDIPEPTIRHPQIGDLLENIWQPEAPVIDGIELRGKLVDSICYVIASFVPKSNRVDSAQKNWVKLKLVTSADEWFVNKKNQVDKSLRFYQRSHSQSRNKEHPGWNDLSYVHCISITEHFMENTLCITKRKLGNASHDNWQYTDE